MTLSLWLPTYEGTSAESIRLVEDALNKISRSSYSTAIELHLIPSDSYEEELDAKMSDVNEILTRSEEERKARKQAEREAKKKGETLAVTETETAETEATESDSVNYAPVSSSQMDVFLIRGYDKFMEYGEAGALSQIDDELNGTAKLIRSYVYPTFINQSTVYGARVAVANNHPLGEYTYLLINKELCDSYFYDPTELTSLVKCQDFIEDVGLNSSITPLLGEAETPGLRYWSADGRYSILATMVLDDQDPTAKLNLRNIFALKAYVNTTQMMKELKERGYIGKNPDALDFGVGVVKGTAKDLLKYGVKFDAEGKVIADESKYYVNVLSQPRATTEDVYEAMFAVSTYTKDVRRSMEIIQLINTDPTFRTILQYGVEGVHWKVDESSPSSDPYIKLLRDDYNMKLVETGNVFITYPEEGVPMSYWVDGQNQNLDSILDPFIRFTNFVNDTNKAMFDELDKQSAQILAEVNAMSAAEFSENVSALKEKVSRLEVYDQMTRTKQNENDDFEPLAMKYNDFYVEYMQPKE
jgi:putative aldouronate transport system substrate-binding protein